MVRREGAEGLEVRQNAGSLRAPRVAPTLWAPHSTQEQQLASTQGQGASTHGIQGQQWASTHSDLAPHSTHAAAGQPKIDAPQKRGERGRGAAGAGADTHWLTGTVRSSAERKPSGKIYEDVDEGPPAMQRRNSSGDLASCSSRDSQATTKVFSGAAQPQAQPLSGVPSVKRKGVSAAASQREDKKPRGSPRGSPAGTQAGGAPNSLTVTSDAHDLCTLKISGIPKIPFSPERSFTQPEQARECDDSEWTLGPGLPPTGM